MKHNNYHVWKDPKELWTQLEYYKGLYQAVDKNQEFTRQELTIEITHIFLELEARGELNKKCESKKKCLCRESITEEKKSYKR